MRRPVERSDYPSPAARAPRLSYLGSDFISSERDLADLPTSRAFTFRAARPQHSPISPSHAMPGYSGPECCALGASITGTILMQAQHSPRPPLSCRVSVKTADGKHYRYTALHSSTVSAAIAAFDQFGGDSKIRVSAR